MHYAYWTVLTSYPGNLKFVFISPSHQTFHLMFCDPGLPYPVPIRDSRETEDLHILYFLGVMGGEGGLWFWKLNIIAKITISGAIFPIPNTFLLFITLCL